MTSLSPTRQRRNCCWCYRLSLVVAALILPHAFAGEAPTIYEAKQPESNDALLSTEDVETNYKKGAYWSWLPSTAQQDDQKRVGFIYYPGIFYEEIGYAPVLRAVAREGFPSFLLDGPLEGLSILNPFQADLVIKQYPQVDAWVVGGHSLGGVVASLYVKSRPKAGIEGLALFASFPSNDLSSTGIKALSLWGNRDGLVPESDWLNGMNQLPESAKFQEIDGGNHSQMGWITETQEGDNEATISQAEQSQIVVAAIVELLDTIQADG
jgi:hypothetical protein